MPSNVIGEPVCDLETAVGLRLIAAEETVAFADENLLQIPSTTNQPQETGKVVSLKTLSFKFNHWTCTST